MQLKWLIFLSMLISYPLLVQSQGRVADEEFGKNRVQYHDDFNNWWRYESQNTITYWYGKGRNIAEVVFQLAEYDYDEIQTSLQHRLNDKIEIIVFTDITDLKQSNIGTTEQFETQAGQTKIVENKVFVHFNGSHSDLRRQIREGMTRVFLDQMMFGSNIQEIIQSAIALDFPQWFKEGLIAHLGDTWNYEDDSNLRDLFYHSDINDFTDLANLDVTLTGKAFWHYLQLHYERSTLANLLYLTRINRNLENGFVIVLGKSMDQIKSQIFSYFEKKYLEEKALFKNELIWSEIEGFSNKRSAEITDIKLSPDGQMLAYVENEIGRNRVFLHNLHTGKREVLFREGFRNPFQDPDYNYPMISWSPDGNRLLILYERGDVIKIREKVLNSDEYLEQEIAPIYQRVYDFDYYDDRTLVLAATTDGFSDIYFYDLPNRQSNRITNDIFDHKWVETYNWQGNKGILFSSNRQTTELERIRRDSLVPVGPFDLFFYDPNREEESVIKLTSSPHSRESQIRHTGGNNFKFLSDLNGVDNVYSLELELGEPKNLPLTFENSALTNSPTPIHTFDYRENTLVAVRNQRGIPTIFKCDLAAVEQRKIPGTLLKSKLYGAGEFELDLPAPPPVNLDEIEEGEKFQSQFKATSQSPFSQREPAIRQNGKSKRILDRSTKEWGLKSEPFVSARAVASRLHFRFEEVSTSLDNSLLFSGLDAYSGIQEGFEVPPLGILIRSKAYDIFEDYVFEGGMRVPTSFNGSEFYLIFDDKKRRWNKRYAFYRRSRSERESARFGSFDQTKNTTTILQNRWTYPFNIFRSLRLTGTLRLDRFIFQSTSEASLEMPDFNRQSIGVRAEYVFDNSYDVLINIKNGSRYKFYVEGVNQFRIQFSPMDFEASSGFMTVIGFDARHYQRFLKHSVIAIRGAGASSLGSERILFYMGGVENWLSPSFNQNIPVPEDEKFAYQALALNMRGFEQNIRNGSSFLVMNTELRVPFFHYFSRTPPRSGLLNSFQLVGFFDLGYTWFGSDPFGGQNPLNNATISNPVSTIEVEYFRDPAVMGMGVGIRALLFGYFIRVDRGWGVETRKIQPPRWHVSLGYDF